MGYLKCYCRRRQFHQVQKAHQVKKENVFERPSVVETKKERRKKKKIPHASVRNAKTINIVKSIPLASPSNQSALLLIY